MFLYMLVINYIYFNKFKHDEKYKTESLNKMFIPNPSLIKFGRAIVLDIAMTSVLEGLNGL